MKNKKYFDALENLLNDHDVYVPYRSPEKEENEWEVNFTSPQGEDFWFTLNCKDPVNSVNSYYEDFDPEEHANMWYHTEGKGAPQSLRTLLDDADAIDAKLEELVTLIAQFDDDWDDEEEED